MFPVTENIVFNAIHLGQAADVDGCCKTMLADDQFIDCWVPNRPAIVCSHMHDRVDSEFSEQLAHLVECNAKLTRCGDPRWWITLGVEINAVEWTLYSYRVHDSASEMRSIARGVLNRCEQVIIDASLVQLIETRARSLNVRFARDAKLLDPH